MDEVWLFITDMAVPDIQQLRYAISNYGNVYDYYSNIFPSQIIDSEGYKRIWIRLEDNTYKLCYIHRLEKITFDGFDPDENKNTVDHVDCNKNNNFIGNLEWVTQLENSLRAIKNGLYPQFNVKMNEDDVRYICDLLSQGKSYKFISDILYSKYNQDTIGMIGKIYRGERWKHISKDYMPFPPLKKEKVYQKNSYMNEEMVRFVCENLAKGERIPCINHLIREKYMIDYDFRNIIQMIKSKKCHKDISFEYDF